MLNKLLGKKKKENYFLEFEDKNKQQVSPKTESKGIEAKPTTSEEKTETPDSQQATPQTSETKPPTQEQYAVSYDPPEWVKAIKNYSNQDANGTSGEGANSGGFAGKYVTNNVPMSRRRPGPSLNKFKEIASKIDA